MIKYFYAILSASHPEERWMLSIKWRLRRHPTYYLKFQLQRRVRTYNKRFNSSQRRGQMAELPPDQRKSSLNRVSRPQREREPRSALKDEKRRSVTSPMSPHAHQSLNEKAHALPESQYIPYRHIPTPPCHFDMAGGCLPPSLGQH